MSIETRIKQRRTPQNEVSTKLQLIGPKKAGLAEITVVSLRPKLTTPNGVTEKNCVPQPRSADTNCESCRHDTYKATGQCCTGKPCGR